MYSLVLIAGLSLLLLALLGTAVLVLLPRTPRRPKPPAKPQEPAFASEFIGELNRLQEDDVYSLHEKGVPPTRIASQLGMAKADVELLIKVAARPQP